MKPIYETKLGRLYCGDVLETLKHLPNDSVQCCVTSPPYWGLRDYGIDQQIGLEQTPEAYTSKLVKVFLEVHRVLKPDGTLWLNLGDSYIGGGRAGKEGFAFGGLEAQNRCNQKVKWGKPTGKIPGYKSKDLVGIPWLVAFALRNAGWYLRQDIIWNKPNPMPESVTDRCTKAHEYIFLMSKSQKYYFETIKETSRIKRSVWTINTTPTEEAHFATFPLNLIKPCVEAGCPKGEMVLDPFMGSGTVGLICEILNRKWIGIELNPEYCTIAKKRINQEALKPKLF